MRIEKVKNGIAAQPPKTRNLTVYYKFREIPGAGFFENNVKEVPEIRLCGNWLQNLGFSPGSKISIITTQGKLVIQLQPE